MRQYSYHSPYKNIILREYLFSGANRCGSNRQGSGQNLGWWWSTQVAASTPVPCTWTSMKGTVSWYFGTRFPPPHLPQIWLLTPWFTRFMSKQSTCGIVFPQMTLSLLAHLPANNMVTCNSLVTWVGFFWNKTCLKVLNMTILISRGGKRMRKYEAGWALSSLVRTQDDTQMLAGWPLVSTDEFNRN